MRFEHAITAAAAAGHHRFIEISPHPLLTHAITDTLTTTDLDPETTAVLPTLLRDTDDTLTFHTHLAT
ncbi:acyltransferase domain-containing protein, partial [Mycolicibacillus trivialis]